MTDLCLSLFDYFCSKLIPLSSQLDEAIEYADCISAEK